MRLSDVACAASSPMRSTASTVSSLDEAMRQSLFGPDPLGMPTTRNRETLATEAAGITGRFPRLLWRCNMSARNLLIRERSDTAPTDSSNSIRRSTYGALFSTRSRSDAPTESRYSIGRNTLISLLSTGSRSSVSRECRPRRQRSASREQPLTPRQTSNLLCERGDNLQLFREEAEYSDYLTAYVTGQHIERLEDGIVFYGIEVHFSKQKWRVVRRFSEFRALRQQLIKHFSRGKNRRLPRCPICENVLSSILDVSFPSRHLWGAHLFSSSSLSITEEEVINERKSLFPGFVVMCLATVRSLRQHLKVLPDSEACEISVGLRLIEEFLGLSFTRYLGFLSERGIVDQSEPSKQRPPQQRRQEAFDISAA